MLEVLRGRKMWGFGVFGPFRSQVVKGTQKCTYCRETRLFKIEPSLTFLRLRWCYARAAEKSKTGTPKCYFSHMFAGVCDSLRTHYKRLHGRRLLYSELPVSLCISVRRRDILRDSWSSILGLSGYRLQPTVSYGAT